MGLLDDMNPHKTATGCKVWKIRQGLEPSDQKLWDAMINDAELWKAETLSRQLRPRGIQVASSVIRLHRDMNCACRNL